MAFWSWEISEYCPDLSLQGAFHDGSVTVFCLLLLTECEHIFYLKTFLHPAASLSPGLPQIYPFLPSSLLSLPSLDIGV